MIKTYRSDSGILVSDDMSVTDLCEIGRGMYRMVYDLKDGTVLKKAHTGLNDLHQFSNRACNLLEQEIWNKYKDSSTRLGLAEVIACSEDGSWLIMERAANVVHYAYLVDLPERDKHYLFGQLKKAFLAVYPSLGYDDIHSQNLAVMPDDRIALVDYADPRKV